MKKKIIIGAILAVAITVGSYFGIMHAKNGVPWLEEGFGILESEVEFRNVYPGWEGSAPLTVINGKDRDRTFSISLEQPNPNKLKNGYEAFPVEYYSWITITEPEISLEAGQHHEQIIIFAMPEDANYEGKQTEVRIRVSDMTPTGLVTLAVESRWYIITAELESS